MARRLVVTGFALILIAGTPIAASAATKKALYRTTTQAEHYLMYGLKHWAGADLGRADLRSAFCVSGFSARPEASEHYSQSRANRAGTPIYRTFACTLDTVVNKRTRVFGLYLVTTHSGWRVTLLH